MKAKIKNNQNQLKIKEKKLDATEKQKKNQPEIKKDDKAKDIVYLKEGTNELFRIYSKSFNKKHKFVGSPCTQ